MTPTSKKVRAGQVAIPSISKRLTTVLSFEASPNQELIQSAAATDGVFPLITNADEFSIPEVLEKYKLTVAAQNAGALRWCVQSGFAVISEMPSLKFEPGELDLVSRTFVPTVPVK